ncbi:hypothetical protein HHI36_010071 [Cryptolaemus montrouzieri]|uniref:Arrestin-like N-terminal domain-containing protein n=1 Tax=Cryptolaemus montrouzieri TaxID=559131 RepID=A0ABD2MHP5_9CUCU
MEKTSNRKKIAVNVKLTEKKDTTKREVKVHLLTTIQRGMQGKLILKKHVGWYIGRIVQVGEYIKLKFLKEDLGRYLWPKKDDLQFVDKQFIFYGPIDLFGNDPFTISEHERYTIECEYKNPSKFSNSNKLPIEIIF